MPASRSRRMEASAWRRSLCEFPFPSDPTDVFLNMCLPLIIRLSRNLGRILALLLPVLFGCRHTNPVESETAPSWDVLSHRARKDARTGRVDFTSHIKPIFEAKCVMCHSGDRPQGGFRIERAELAFAEGAHGRRIIPGQSLRSPLIKNLDDAHAGLKVMPPVGNRVTVTEQAILRRWIDQGAPWPVGAAGRLSVDEGSAEPVAP